jgi:hypothetical protein
MRKQKKPTKFKKLKVLLGKSSFTDKRATPHIWAWAAVAWIDAAGRCAQSGAEEAMPIFAVSVHEDYPTTLRDRLTLLEHVASEMGAHVPAGRPSLWLFPGGFFGFDASEGNWLGLNTIAPGRIKRQLTTILTAFPSRATIAMGVDTGEGDSHDQQAWIVNLDSGGAPDIRMIRRSVTDLPRRKVTVGPVRAAFFICGEFTGSTTQQNGPYFQHQYLKPAADLSDCQLLVDLAHRRVRHTINSWANCPKRLVHQRQMERFSNHGAAILTHHHGGERIGKGNHQKTDCCSNWIVFQGGKWLKEVAVKPIRARRPA